MNEQTTTYTKVTRANGAHRGIVTENLDPDGRGRIKVSLPHLFGEDDIWAEPCMPLAGEERGFFVPPKIDSGIWVIFNRGFINQPIWIGGYWGDNQIEAEDSAEDRFVWRTPNIRICLDAKSNELLLEIIDGASFTIRGQEITLKASKITLEANGSKLVFDGMLDVKNGNFKVM